MRVTNVALYANNEEAVSFSLRASEPTAQYMIRAMAGLDAEDIVPKFYGFGLKTQPRFYDMGMKARDIVMRIVLNPRFNLDESYSDVRDDLYRVISATRTGAVTLHFNSGGTTVAQISGFITKFEVPHFSALPEAQLTVTCNDPMLRAINPVILEPADLKTVNPIIIADSLSTAPHGFDLQVTFSAATPAFTVQDAATTPEWVFKVIPNGGFAVGDKLYFSSEYADKQLYMVRGGVTTHLVDRIQPGSIWPIIFPGANPFYFLEIGSFTWNELLYYAAYWGV